MKSFDRIAKAMYEAFCAERSKSSSVQWKAWEECPAEVRDAWIAAAKEAHRQITEVL